MSPSLPAPATVLVADSDDVARIGLCTLLHGDARFTLVGETRTDVLALVTALHPDVVVIDPCVAGRVDLPLLTALLTRESTTRVCVWTAALDPAAYVHVVRRGLHACQWKGVTSSTALCNVVDLVATTASRIVAPLPDEATRWLTCDEREVLAQLGGGARQECVTLRRGAGTRSIERIVRGLKTKLCAPTPYTLGMQAALLGMVFPNLSELLP